jgi:catechol 2,3-dioxygenase-like lactoylglutathione lyase family enzyme
MEIVADAEPMVFVLTADRARSVPFYEKVLGLPLVASDPFAVTFRLGNGTPLRLTDLPGHVASAHTVLGWTVPDIAAAVALLKERGVAMNVYEGFGQDELGIWQAPDRSARIVWFNDPEGNVLSLKQD